MKKILIPILLALIIFPECIMAKGKNKYKNVKDMVLIYSGGQHRNMTWTPELFAPYVAYQDESNSPEWLFDGFLFLEIKDGAGRGFASYYEKLAARKEEWTKLVDGYFTPGQDICALNEAIEKVKGQVPGKFKKRKIVLSIPEPIPNDTTWGMINGKKMNFSDKEDRIAACRWYVDYCIEKFKKAKLKNVELAGFYWLAEEATNSRNLAQDVSAYVTSKNYSFNWIPYFKSDGFKEWQALGFTKAFLQPNHFFNKDIPYSRLEEACKLAIANQMAMEVEFDERALKKTGWGSRLKDYLRAFKEFGVLDNQDIAYYQGGKAVYLLANSEQEEDKALYDELARIIVERQKTKK